MKEPLISAFHSKMSFKQAAGAKGNRNQTRRRGLEYGRNENSNEDSKGKVALQVHSPDIKSTKQ